MSWQPFSTAPKDCEILATHTNRRWHKALGRSCGQRLRWNAKYQDWEQFVGGSWHLRPFFTPTHWTEIPASGERPEPMF